MENVIGKLLSRSVELAMARKGGLKPASVPAVHTSHKRRASQSIASTSTPEPRTVAPRLRNEVVFDDEVCSWQLVGKGDCKLIPT